MSYPHHAVLFFQSVLSTVWSVLSSWNIPFVPRHTPPPPRTPPRDGWETDVDLSLLQHSSFLSDSVSDDPVFLHAPLGLEHSPSFTHRYHDRTGSLRRFKSTMGYGNTAQHASDWNLAVDLFVFTESRLDYHWEARRLRCPPTTRVLLVPLHTHTVSYTRPRLGSALSTWALQNTRNVASNRKTCSRFLTKSHQRANRDYSHFIIIN